MSRFLYLYLTGNRRNRGKEPY